MKKKSYLIFIFALILNYSCSNNGLESENSDVQNNDSIQITQDNIELDTVNIVEEPKTKDTDIIPNPILVNSDFTIDYSEFASYITFNIDKRYFYGEEQNDFTDNTIKLAINYSLKDGTVITGKDKDFINNKDKNVQFFIKYKTATILEGDAMSDGSPVQELVIDDYEIIGKSPVTAKFTDFQMGDYPYYIFTTDLGYNYSFNKIENNKHNYEFEYTDENAPSGKPSEKLLNEKFKIYFHYEIIENDYVGGEFKYFYIDSINLQN